MKSHLVGASIAASLSSLAGARSIGSSVILKSPIMKSSVLSLSLDHSVFTFSQKVLCSLGLFGAYIFRMFIVLLSCHLTDRVVARPGISTCIFVLAVLVISLFSTNVTPAELPGRVGSLEFSMVSLREYSVSIWVWCSGLSYPF